MVFFSSDYLSWCFEQFLKSLFLDQIYWFGLTLLQFWTNSLTKMVFFSSSDQLSWCFGWFPKTFIFWTKLTDLDHPFAILDGLPNKKHFFFQFWPTFLMIWVISQNINFFYQIYWFGPPFCNFGLNSLTKIVFFFQFWPTVLDVLEKFPKLLFVGQNLPDLDHPFAILDPLPNKNSVFFQFWPSFLMFWTISRNLYFWTKFTDLDHPFCNFGPCSLTTNGVFFQFWPTFLIVLDDFPKLFIFGLNWLPLDHPFAILDGLPNKSTTVFCFQFWPNGSWW